MCCWSPVLQTPAELEAGSLLYLDMVDQALIDDRRRIGKKPTQPLAELTVFAAISCRPTS